MALSPQAQQLVDAGKAVPSHVTDGAVIGYGKDLPPSWVACQFSGASFDADMTVDLFRRDVLLEARPPQPPPVEVGQWRESPTGNRYFVTAVRGDRVVTAFLAPNGELGGGLNPRATFDSYEVCEPDPRWEES